MDTSRVLIRDFAIRCRVRAMKLMLAAVLLALSGAVLAVPDHHELDASLHTQVLGEAISMEIAARFPGAPTRTQTFFTLELLAPDGRVLQTQTGELALTAHKQSRVARQWDTRGLTPAFYTVRMRATAIEPWLLARVGNADIDDRVSRALAFAPNGVHEQQWDVRVGDLPKPQMPAFPGLVAGHARAVDPPGGLPYRVYFANLHSQTNHSDGGGDVSTCDSSLGAQNGEYGPPVAFEYARNHGLDVLATTEHNHYFDGSSGTNSSATPAQAIGLYQSGIQAALDFNAKNPNFLAVYAMEWGVISNGGHLNIFGGNQLFGWEYNASNQLLAEVFTARSSYPPLYALMRANGLVGQFNHPATSGQFLVNGTALGYDANGDEVMVLSEIMNTSAFSNNTTETETSRSSYEGAFNRLLERGFHVAPATNQDNHCANWGASYSNRTGVMLPTGTAMTPTSLIDALRARRVFATMDKSSQIVLRSGNHLMGERFVNVGPLSLQVLFASTGGHSVNRVQIFEGVPGRNGTVTTLIEAATHTFTPSPGAHFYWARITQEDGDLLWSAPIWVEQLADNLLRDGFEGA